jgi:uncharacterized OsmC-like protein
VETHATIQNGQVDTSRSGKFANVGDEPADLSGTDSGMGPAEYILQALAGCYTATLTVMAAEKGIELDGIELDLNFDINLNGFLVLTKKFATGRKRSVLALSSPVRPPAVNSLKKWFVHCQKARRSTIRWRTRSVLIPVGVGKPQRMPEHCHFPTA